jgi:hypothetical protein
MLTFSKTLNDNYVEDNCGQLHFSKFGGFQFIEIIFKLEIYLIRYHFYIKKN